MYAICKHGYNIRHYSSLDKEFFFFLSFFLSLFASLSLCTNIANDQVKRKICKKKTLCHGAPPISMNNCLFVYFYLYCSAHPGRKCIVFHPEKKTENASKLVTMHFVSRIIKRKQKKEFIKNVSLTG